MVETIAEALREQAQQMVVQLLMQTARALADLAVQTMAGASTQPGKSWHDATPFERRYLLRGRTPPTKPRRTTRAARVPPFVMPPDLAVRGVPLGVAMAAAEVARWRGSKRHVTADGCSVYLNNVPNRLASMLESNGFRRCDGHCATWAWHAPRD